MSNFASYLLVNLFEKMKKENHVEVVNNNNKLFECYNLK